jgi:phospholipid transport system substrate-binding protein
MGARREAGDPGKLATARAAAAIFIALLAVPVPVRAGEPTAQIRNAIEQGIAVVKNPDLAGKGMQAERRARLREAVAPSFDFREMAKRSLGIYWKDRSPSEREEFTRLYQDLLENSYAGKIESYQGEKIVYGKETVDPPYAVVRTEIVTMSGHEIPVNYMLLLEGNRWRIYDVMIEGISLVNNYRAQFGSILQKSSFQELMRKLKATIGRQEKG